MGIDASTLEIRAIEVTDNATGDAPMLPCLLEQIAKDEHIASVSGDGAYDTKACHEAIARRGAQAIIPTRRNARPWKDKRPGAAARNAILDATRRLGRRIWKNGPAIIGAASSRRKCAVSSCSVSASWHMTSTVRLPNFKCVPQS